MDRLLRGLALAAVFLPLSALAEDIILRDGFAVALGGRMARAPFRTDPVEARIVAGLWRPPTAGDVVELPGGTNRVWEHVTAKADGTFEHPALRGGYIQVPFVSDRDRILLLQASGHSMAYVNGEPRAGDIYRNGSVSLPIAIKAGTNDLLFATGRGALSIRLAEPEPIAIDPRDPTLPDLVRGRRNDAAAAVLVVNASQEPLSGLVLRATPEGGTATESPVPTLPPLGVHKTPFRVLHPGKSRTNLVALDLSLQRGRTTLAQRTFKLGLVSPEATRRETFVSEIDGSVQYYGFVPSRPMPGDEGRPGLVLSTHGAGVEGMGQAACYAPKTRLHIAAPTNRRPFGFDWEDWGRRDAIEVLDRVQRLYETDPSRTYLTGHSMGGHGTWQLGATYPDRFAALAPSAGWISFASYGGGRRAAPSNEVQRLIQRAWTPSDTLALATNYTHHGIYILHGDADDNVPVTEARTMREVLGTFHRDFAWHEQPGAGHWWGNQCLDWPPIFDLFARRRIPSPHEVRRLRFVTANPGVSARCQWASIEAQVHALSPSRVDLEWDAPSRRIVGTTENVARLALHLDVLPPGAAPTVSLDGQVLTNLPAPPTTGSKATPTPVWLERSTGAWTVAGPSPRVHKGPHRAGPFKEAFAHRILLLYATGGTAAENAWALAKARFDSESFWYRGNASLEVLPDTAFDPRRHKDRGVILYGNADTHAAWRLLLADSPVQVRRGSVRMGGREVRGDQLACLFLRPRPDSDTASVGVVSGTGLEGMRLCDRVPYFMAGVALPDVTVFGPETLSRGTAGVRATGYFGNDWSVERGEFAWSDEPR
ncbi:MAG: prolyl oligopeptidase family serine peptidase [Verrucomicrobiota bacterium]|jgi:poly(3-hydroxybutyrate) depolymerase